uniref:ARID domain-containing protein n=1 Tax=Cajanus cajan TaxID=3821 RepID=A0A151TAZ9_CAJCA|nr:hypothetical protein KK1_018819 [Cajanus cajan]
MTNGEPLDLYKLFMVVKEKGGYDAVCKNRLWDLVGEEYGLGGKVGSSVELVYSKHLGALETCFKNVADEEERGDEFERRVCECPDGRKLCGTNRVKGVKPESNVANEVQSEGYVDLDMLDNGANEPIPENFCSLNTERDILNVPGVGKILTVDASDAESDMPMLSDGSKSCDNDDDNNSGEVLILDPSSVDRKSFGRKRKRETKSEMLSWITSIAKNPCDPAVGSMPEKSKWKSYSSREMWKQALLFRESVFLKKDFQTTTEKLSWQGQKMHPSMYEDRVGGVYSLRQRLKCDKRLLSGNSKSDGVSSSIGTHGDKCARVRVPVGPKHQAEVPKWTDMTYESDSKWLGTQIWPLEEVNSKLLVAERDPIGKGRQDSCGCQVQGSVECVRFHIVKQKSKVKLELGDAFFRWDFHKAGEEVRGSWTEQEEKKFKDVVKSNPASLDKCFWDHLFKTFPTKSREDLVSYYFNVFLLQRRAYQNRYTPDNIDSDDDESEFTPLRKIFGHQSQKSRSFTLLSPKKATDKTAK